MQAAAFIAVEAAFLAVAHVVGGPAWTSLGAVACLMVVRAGLRPALLVPLVPAVAWTIAARATGNRELYFPFAMHLAAGAGVAGVPASPWTAVAAAAVACGFLAARWLQDAPPRVLAVETVATAAVLAAAAALATRLPEASRRWLVPAAAALLACACLAC